MASPAYVPRTTGSLKMPLTAADVIAAAKSYLKDLKVRRTGSRRSSCSTRPRSSSTESDPAPAKQVATPVAPATGGTGSTPTPTPPSTPGPAEEDPANTPPANDPSLPASPAASGAPVDLWDSGWPNGRFYWTVVPVAFESAAPTQTTLAQATAPGAGSLQRRQRHGFRRGQLIRIGTDSTQETLTIASVDAAEPGDHDDGGHVRAQRRRGRAEPHRHARLLGSRAAAGRLRRRPRPVVREGQQAARRRLDLPVRLRPLAAAAG